MIEVPLERNATQKDVYVENEELKASKEVEVALLSSKKNFKFHAQIKKCHFGNFSDRAGMAVHC